MTPGNYGLRVLCEHASFAMSKQQQKRLFEFATRSMSAVRITHVYDVICRNILRNIYLGPVEAQIRFGFFFQFL